MSGRRELANAIRVLSMDAVQKANSGHPGMPMGMADIAEVLWNEFLQHNPKNPHWFNRDRFVLSVPLGPFLSFSSGCPLLVVLFAPIDRRLLLVPSIHPFINSFFQIPRSLFITSRHVCPSVR